MTDPSSGERRPGVRQLRLVAVAEELRGRIECPWGVEARPWGATELVVRDPDGYHVTFTGGP